MEDDLFDFNDLNGSQAYSDFALPLDFNESISCDQFNTSETLQDNFWTDDDSHTCMQENWTWSFNELTAFISF